MMKRTGDKLYKDNRGSALVSVFLIICVILIIGMGIIALSASNAAQAKVNGTYEKDYYAADGAAKQEVEALRNAALEQYRLIAADVQNYGENTASNNYVDFFSNIKTAMNAYTAVQPDPSAGGPTSITLDQIKDDGGNPTRVYTIAATASDAKTSRKIATTVSITFKKVTLSAAAFTPLGTDTIISGGMFDCHSGNVDLGTSGTPATAHFAALNATQYHFNWNGNSQMTVAQLQAGLVDTNLQSEITWWNMKYPGFTSAVKVPSGQLSLPTFNSATTVSNGSFNWHIPSPIYLDLEGASGTYTLDGSFSYIGGQIYCTTNLNMSSPYITGTAANNVKIYCKGALSISGSIVSYTTIYCDGNVTINGGSSYNHVTIYCNGTISDSCTDRYNDRYYCKNYTMSGGNFDYSASDDMGNMVYAESSMHLESNVSGFFYTNGTMTCNGGKLYGQAVAKGGITTPGYSFYQDSAMMAKIYTNPFLSSSPADTSIKVVQPKNTEIFTNTPTYSEK